MLAGADVVADSASDRLVDGRELVDGDAVGAEEFVDGVGVQCALELAVGVGPEVGVGADDVDGAGGDESG